MGQLPSRHQPSLLSPGLIAMAWVVTLYTSELSTVLWSELVGPVPPGLLWSKLVLLAALAVASLFWQTLRPLRNYFLIFLVIYGLATLEPAAGPGQAMLLTAFVFGIGHFYGVPYGIVGAVMAGALGWILNKTMLETRGFFWPWFIHFCQDALVFSFMALGAVAAGN